MISNSMQPAKVALTLLAVVASLGSHQLAWARLSASGNIDGGQSPITDVLNVVPATLSAVTDSVNGLTSPLLNGLGVNRAVDQALPGMAALTGGQNGLIGNTLRLTQGAVGGVYQGAGGGLTNLLSGNGVDPERAGPHMVSSPNGLANPYDYVPIGGANLSPDSMGGFNADNQQTIVVNQNAAGVPSMVRNMYKRQALPDSAMYNMMAGAGSGAGAVGAEMMAANGAVGAEMMAAGAENSAALAGANSAAYAGAAEAQQGAEAGYMAAGAMGGAMGGAIGGAMAGAAGAAAAAGASGMPLAAASGYSNALAAGPIANAAVNSAAAGAAAAAATGSALVGAQSGALLGRQALAAEAIRNAQAESAMAGAEMVQNGAINARSASMASNAYRQAKLASARDRVNIAGTIQNSARISDAAIATHDAATKAEDSLLGSELSVDSAATVFDSDGAYIPPVTASLLRSLPYGRLGLRNIIPKPLTHPSVMLPDVWLNGVPVNYQNIPLKMLPNGIGPAQSYNSFAASQMAATNGAIFNGQPFISNNGMVLNELIFDPAYAYLTGAGAGFYGPSLMPIIANGQLEAQDELAMANLFNMQQLNGAGMSSTYQGYGRLNPVPMITGSVSDVNLMPTTTVGTTYPIGSALVIEPRDSFFQDYTDNASSRQNMDERQQ